MKKILFIIVLATITHSCKEKTGTVSTTENAHATESTTNPEEKEEMLVGIIDNKKLEKAPYHDWYYLNFKGHILDKQTINQFAPLLNGVSIKVFMGTWCSDSQREVPALYKILDQAKFNYHNFKLIALDRDKKTKNGLEKGYTIEYVPTIIFYKNGKEINRIVEAPQETLEKDILAILSNTGYKHIYLDD